MSGRSSHWSGYSPAAEGRPGGFGDYFLRQTFTLTLAKALLRTALISIDYQPFAAPEVKDALDVELLR